jgi:hypothetical protein
LEQTLNGKIMATNILKKSNTRLKFMYRQARNLDLQSRKTLCSSLILSHFDYASSSWYSGLPSNLKIKLQTCLNKIARFVLNLGPRQHIGPMELTKIGWLNVQSRVAQLKLNIVHSIFHRQCPPYLLENFESISHQYNTRSSNLNFKIPNSTTIIQTTFYYSGIKLWNALPKIIQNIENKHNFKFHLKKHLAEQMVQQV